MVYLHAESDWADRVNPIDSLEIAQDHSDLDPNYWNQRSIWLKKVKIRLGFWTEQRTCSVRTIQAKGLLTWIAHDRLVLNNIYVMRNSCFPEQKNQKFSWHWEGAGQHLHFTKILSFWCNEKFWFFWSEKHYFHITWISIKRSQAISIERPSSVTEFDRAGGSQCSLKIGSDDSVHTPCSKSPIRSWLWIESNHVGSLELDSDRPMAQSVLLFNLWLFKKLL